ncbi:MAG: methyl-accepting chemotaxis protein [Deltaproteobacteria bacterium]|nr:methyl-accepting chemotaxis protein [Deltaproteobacteria bacterium]MBI3294392.1 methyl-accepting chemotaxis protein [Deltaproteobacteria bacterium]
MDYTEQRQFKSMPVQLKYAVILTLITAAMNLILTFVVAWFVQRNYNLFMGDELGISAQVVEIVRREQRLLEWALLILFLASVFVTFASTLFVTRKLTGPIISLERHLIHFSRGDWTRDFRLRKNDEFKELEAIVNDLRKTHLADAHYL